MALERLQLQAQCHVQLVTLLHLIAFRYWRNFRNDKDDTCPSKHVQCAIRKRMVAVHAWKPISKRPMGRPKIRWEIDSRKDIWRLKVPNWKTFVQDRRRWKEVVDKAKTLH